MSKKNGHFTLHGAVLFHIHDQVIRTSFAVKGEEHYILEDLEYPANSRTVVGLSFLIFNLLVICL